VFVKGETLGGTVAASPAFSQPAAPAVDQIDDYCPFDFDE
jgi:hypothetical protein